MVEFTKLKAYDNYKIDKDLNIPVPTKIGSGKGVKYKIIDTIEYCPMGHQNNLLLDGVDDLKGGSLTRVTNKCPVVDCPYH